MGLNKLVVLYDSNHITIEGDTATAFAEDVLKRFDAYGWHTQEVEDGNDVDAIAAAIEAAKAADKPSIIKIETKIGYGAPNKQGKASAHGEPLGDEEIKLAKENLGWPYPDTTFYVPEEVKAHVAEINAAGAKAEADWNEMFKAYAENILNWQKNTLYGTAMNCLLTCWLTKTSGKMKAISQLVLHPKKYCRK